MASNERIFDRVCNRTCDRFCFFDPKIAVEKLTGLTLLAERVKNSADLPSQEKEQCNGTNYVSAMDKFNCQLCDVEFVNSETMREHFKSDEHIHKIALSLAKQKLVDIECHGQMGNTSDAVSSPASASDMGSNLPNQSTDSDNSYPELGASSHKQMVYFRSRSGEIIGIHRCVLFNRKTIPTTMGELLSCVQRVRQSQRWAVLLYSGGKFAGGIFDGPNEVVHKTLHHYTVRAKQGGGQSSYDASNSGMGGAKSAGASLRRYGEMAIRAEISNLLHNRWRTQLQSCQFILVWSPKVHRNIFFNPPVSGNTDNGPTSDSQLEPDPNAAAACQAGLGMTSDDVRVRRIPCRSNDITYAHVKELHRELSSFYVYESYSQHHNWHRRLRVAIASGDSVALQNLLPAVDPQTSGGPRVNATQSNTELMNDSFAPSLSSPGACVPSSEICSLLLNYPLAEGRTLLHLAVEFQQEPEVLSLLLENGCDPALRDAEGKTPYNLAASLRKKQLTSVFRRFRFFHPDRYDYDKAQIPAPLDPNVEAEKAERDRERQRKQRQRVKERKAVERARMLKEKEELAEKERFMALSDREKSSSNGAVSAAAPDALSLRSGDSAHSLDDVYCSPNRSIPHCVHRAEGTERIEPHGMGQSPVESARMGTVCTDSVPQKAPVYIAAGEIRNRLLVQSEHQPHRSFKSDPEDPSAAALKEPWSMKCQRIREHSPWGSLPGWRLTAAIVKVGDDLRQEQLAYQLLRVLQRIWQMEYVTLWLRPLTVIVTSQDSGLIEPVPDTVSLHQIKRHARLSLLDYFLREHGPSNSEAFLTSQRNFVQSCAAYCLVGYLLQVKDRHNGNILLDNQGHVIHINYGFMLSASPGKNLGFETSPFKLTAEQVEVMGGVGSDMFEYYKCLLLSGLIAARKHMEEICVLVEIARATCPQLPCFARGSGSAAISGLRQRFLLHRTEEQLRQTVERMVEGSLHSMTTRLYDSFQYYTNGIQ